MKTTPVHNSPPFSQEHPEPHLTLAKTEEAANLTWGAAPKKHRKHSDLVLEPEECFAHLAFFGWDFEVVVSLPDVLHEVA